MNRRQQVAVLGGDERQIYLARMLAQRGYTVFAWGLGETEGLLGDGKPTQAWREAIEGAGSVILPLPASSDGVRVHCPRQDREDCLRIHTLLDAMGDRLLLGGRLDPSLCIAAEERGIRCIDYFASETLQLRNALPTAEGAIAIAMR